MTKIEELFNVRGLVAVVTGGGSGIGLMAAKALDANGARAVYVLGRRQAMLDKAASLAVNNSIIPIVADVTSESSLQAAVQRIADEVGYVNVVLANSGIDGVDNLKQLASQYSLDEFQQAMWATPMSQFSNTFHVNITGVFYTAVAFLKLLDAGNRAQNVPQQSQIVITASASSFTRNPIAGFDYGASKAGVMHMMKTMATSLARFKIRVNSIAPGLFPSEMSQGHTAFEGVSDPTVEGSISTSVVPLGRAGSEADFAGVTLFLMSAAGAYLNGVHILSDGGRVTQVPSSY